jgi:hypothetical protein
MAESCQTILLGHDLHSGIARVGIGDLTGFHVTSNQIVKLPRMFPVGCFEQGDAHVTICPSAYDSSACH